MQDSAGAGTTARGRALRIDRGRHGRDGVLIATIAAVAYVLNVAASATPPDRLRPLVTGGSSQVYAADGTRLGFIQSDELRTPVGWNVIPEDLKNATVAIEDQRFYKHNGVDVTGIFRAAVKDAANGAACRAARRSRCS